MPQEAGAKCPLLTRAMPCVLGVLGIASAYYLWRQFKVTEKRVRIDEMHLYPVKGARGTSLVSSDPMSLPDCAFSLETGIKLDTWLVTPRGLQYDRHFMAVCAETSGFLTQRNCPNLATIDTAVTETHLILSKEGDSVQVPLCAGNNSAPSNQEVHSKVFRTPVRGLDCGDAVADFLTTHLGQPARLIRHVPDREHDRQTRFADACALLLANTASLRAVNRDLSQHNETQVVMGRFRPNIVVDTKKAFDEDRIKHVDFPSLRMKSLFQCARCIVT
ncbi:MAG: hypothetical protein MHM6MM_007633, partial [Cercozoa sp. M6MM]